jgi:hypothetical protein
MRRRSRTRPEGRFAGTQAAPSCCHFRSRFEQFQRVAAPFPSAHDGRRVALKASPFKHNNNGQLSTDAFPLSSAPGPLARHGAESARRLSIDVIPLFTKRSHEKIAPAARGGVPRKSVTPKTKLNRVLARMIASGPAGARLTQRTSASASSRHSPTALQGTPLDGVTLVTAGSAELCNSKPRSDSKNRHNDRE